jgi:hypothetical protein
MASNRQIWLSEGNLWFRLESVVANLATWSICLTLVILRKPMGSDLYEAAGCTNPCMFANFMIAISSEKKHDV